MPELKLTELCKRLADNGLSATLDGPDRPIRAVNTLDAASDGEISFLANPRYEAALANTRASAVLVKPGVPVPNGTTAVRSADPYAAVAHAVVAIHGYRTHPQWGLSEHATIHPTARIGPGANIAHGVTIAAGVVIGDRATIYPGCYVGDGVRIGHDCVLYPNVVIYDASTLGDRVTVHAGSVIGQDGLGYAPVGQRWVKIPQVGRAVVGDDVEIGANCAIDRATLGTTEIGGGTKFGNVVVIGHGTKVGPDCLFVGQVGVAGSVTIGRHVTLAGQVGVAGHIDIGDNAAIGAQSGVGGRVEPNTKMFGSPAVPAADAMRAAMAVQKLPHWLKRIRRLEHDVADLREKLNGRDE
ncbi:MAG: UDP-3-O-(3-hydroxymyristoyl)glucosamine N-acyltransferase [Phycisphaerae bacterium]